MSKGYTIKILLIPKSCNRVQTIKKIKDKITKNLLRLKTVHRSHLLLPVQGPDARLPGRPYIRGAFF